MGCDATAVLIYGFQIDEIEQEWEEEGYCYYERVKNFIDQNEPPFPHPPNDRQEWLKWLELRNAREAKYPDVEFAGSDGDMNHFIGIVIAKNDWGEIDPITLSYDNETNLIGVSEVQLSNFKKFCEENNIPWQEPKYHLLARYF